MTSVATRAATTGGIKAQTIDRSMSEGKGKDDGDKENHDVVVMDEDDEDDDPMDDEQLEEYREMVEKLGSFPDKVKINSLSMVAEDHADSKTNAAAIYLCIRNPLVSKKVPSDRKLPLVYVVDSILKNVKGKFIQIIEPDVKEWMPIIFRELTEEKRAKLKKVWTLWEKSVGFKESSWREMGKCFEPKTASPSGPDKSSGESNTLSAKLDNAGITRAKDGSLSLKPALRNAMQEILDALQSDEQDELNKVSLERLASIDPDLILKIKRTAEENLRSGGSSGNGRSAPQQDETDDLSFLIEMRTPEALERSKAWKKLDLNHMKDTHDLIASLQRLVREGASTEIVYTQTEAIEMTGSLAAAASTATVLTNALQKIKNEENKSKQSNGFGGSSGSTSSRGYLTIDKSLFTTKGVRQRNDGVIGVLYEVGLPFVSSSDGRRFATQVELSEHLDSLFKKGQLEKSMARTEERGWYIVDRLWTGESSKDDLAMTTAAETLETSGPAAPEDEADPDSFTTPADESRDRCVICGINFKMFFDNDDGIYRYRNCREIEVMNDDAAERESEQMLVHVTCWRALGSPPVMSIDQTLQDSY